MRTNYAKEYGFAEKCTEYKSYFPARHSCSFLRQSVFHLSQSGNHIFQKSMWHKMLWARACAAALCPLDRWVQCLQTIIYCVYWFSRESAEHGDFSSCTISVWGSLGQQEWIVSNTCFANGSDFLQNKVTEYLPKHTVLALKQKKKTRSKAGAWRRGKSRRRQQQRDTQFLESPLKKPVCCPVCDHQSTPRQQHCSSPAAGTVTP